MAQSKNLVLVFCLILMAGLVVAEPRFQTSNPLKGLDIGVAIIETIQVGEDFNFHVHVHNSSNGKLFLASEVEYCLIHIYEPTTGEHIIEDNMTLSGNNIDFEYNVLGGNFTELGQYGALFYCEVDEGGGLGSVGDFVEFPFYVTDTGQSLNEGLAVLYIVYLIGMAFIIILVLYFAIKIPYRNSTNENNEILKINWLKYLKIFLWITVYFSLLFYFGTMSSIFEFYLVYDNASAFFGWAYAILWALLFPMLILAGLIIIMQLVDDKKIKSYIDRGQKVFS